MRTLLWSAWLVGSMGMGVGALGCGGAVETTDDAKGSGAVGGSGAGGQGSGATAGSANGTGGEPPTLGEPCASSDACGADEYCHPLGYTCDDAGECRARPNACDLVYDPICACDGVVYGNACEANAAGQGYALFSNSCEPPTGMFTCGYGFCDVASSYCEDLFESTSSCKPLPASCAPGPTTCVACFGEGDEEELPPLCDSCNDDGLGLSLSCGAL